VAKGGPGREGGLVLLGGAAHVPEDGGGPTELGRWQCGGADCCRVGGSAVQ